MSAPVDVLTAIKTGAAEIECYVGDDATLKIARDLSAAHAAVAELVEALHDLMALYRIKWGNTDSDALKVYERVEAALARFGGAA
jgi:hypothetical protein